MQTSIRYQVVAPPAYKGRISTFNDREAAERTAQRMRDEGAEDVKIVKRLDWAN